LGTDLEQSPAPTIDLVVNTYRGDVPFLEVMMSHITRALAEAPLRERILVVDGSEPVGRFKDSSEARAAMARLTAIADRLEGSGVIDRVHMLDWSDERVEAVMRDWYGDPEAPVSCRAGTAVYQYCSAVDASDADYVLHLDSDILLHSPDGGGWVAEAIALLKAHEDAIVVQPMGGPPIAMTLAQVIFGPRARPARPARGASPGGSVGSRMFVLDRRRLHSCFLPLQPAKSGDRWEQAMTSTAARRGFRRYTFWDERTYASHAFTHGPEFVRLAPDLVWATEQGIYPFRRSGYRWDVRVEGWHKWPWVVSIRLGRLARAFGSTTLGGKTRFGGVGV